MWKVYPPRPHNPPLPLCGLSMLQAMWMNVELPAAVANHEWPAFSDANHKWPAFSDANHKWPAFSDANHKWPASSNANHE